MYKQSMSKEKSEFREGVKLYIMIFSTSDVIQLISFKIKSTRRNISRNGESIDVLRPSFNAAIIFYQEQLVLAIYNLRS